MVDGAMVRNACPQAYGYLWVNISRKVIKGFNLARRAILSQLGNILRVLTSRNVDGFCATESPQAYFSGQLNIRSPYARTGSQLKYMLY
jgi:hypothetical protein